MTEEQPTGKHSMFNYIKQITDLDITNKKVKLIQEKLIGKLDVFLYPLTTVMKRVEDDGVLIDNHWDKYRNNYNSLPVLHSTVPRYKESFGEYVTLSFKEKMILVDVITQLFELTNQIPENTIEVIPEEKEEDIIINPEKKKVKKVNIKPKEGKKDETLSSKDKNTA